MPTTADQTGARWLRPGPMAGPYPENLRALPRSLSPALRPSLGSLHRLRRARALHGMHAMLRQAERDAGIVGPKTDNALIALTNDLRNQLKRQGQKLHNLNSRYVDEAIRTARQTLESQEERLPRQIEDLEHKIKRTTKKRAKADKIGKPLGGYDLRLAKLDKKRARLVGFRDAGTVPPARVRPYRGNNNCKPDDTDSKNRAQKTTQKTY